MCYIDRMLICLTYILILNIALSIEVTSASRVK